MPCTRPSKPDASRCHDSTSRTKLTNASESALAALGSIACAERTAMTPKVASLLYWSFSQRRSAIAVSPAARTLKRCGIACIMAPTHCARSDIASLSSASPRTCCASTVAKRCAASVAAGGITSNSFSSKSALSATRLQLSATVPKVAMTATTSSGPFGKTLGPKRVSSSYSRLHAADFTSGSSTLPATCSMRRTSSFPFCCTRPPSVWSSTEGSSKAMFSSGAKNGVVSSFCASHCSANLMTSMNVVSSDEARWAISGVRSSAA
mmetsp:Transcript_163/g.635  ORF Transcript_163/g.635 Transcript_163/m.635 type:complete len:265 (+) Transcript_163:314-1108(+)